MSELVGWICIGLAAGLVACLWPFPRGAFGIGMNIGGGVAGAVGAAGLGLLLGFSRRNPTILLVAGLGAVVLLGAVHSVWMSRHARPSRRGQMLSRP
jgi:uncharacterized membrane protein YeaQ/YmgE (transglycosylase-associated protein family)